MFRARLFLLARIRYYLKASDVDLDRSPSLGSRGLSNAVHEKIVLHSHKTLRFKMLPQQYTKQVLYYFDVADPWNFDVR
jgi:hypothetical protein